MSYSKLLSFFLYLLHLNSIFGLPSSKELNEISKRIWENECGGTFEGLTTWNKGENFGSFGIGHFIWYPEEKKERFQETFPELIVFLKSHGIELPSWLDKAKGCPWKSREDFNKNLTSSEIMSLRQILYDTRNLQAIFIATRLEKALPEMLSQLPQEQKERVAKNFSILSNNAKGLYALIDYSNFKGMGISPNERYNGQGWGLLQVLQCLSPTSKDLLTDFSNAAKEILTIRVQNSPPERNEDRWLKGWLNRVDTYRTNLESARVILASSAILLAS